MTIEWRYYSDNMMFQGLFGPWKVGKAIWCKSIY